MHRYDGIVIPTNPKGSSSKTTTEEPTTVILPGQVTDKLPLTKALRVDDTPPLGSLGGLQPHTTYVPKVKPVKVKKKKLAPGLMKIYDSEGKEWGRRRRETNTSISLEMKTK